MASLGGMSPVEYLARHVTLTTSRRQLYDKVAQGVDTDTGCHNTAQVFTRNRSTRDGLLSEEATMVALGEVTPTVDVDMILVTLTLLPR